MKKLFFLFIILAGCTAKEMKAIDDALEGEVQTAEKVIQDLSVPSN